MRPKANTAPPARALLLAASLLLLSPPGAAAEVGLSRNGILLDPAPRRLRLAEELRPAQPSGPLQVPGGEQPGSSAPPPESAAPGRPLRLERVLRQQPATPARESRREQGAVPLPIPFAVLINGARAGDWVLLDVGGVLHATADALEEWRLLRSTDEKGVSYRAQPWYPLSSIPGYEAQLDSASQTLNLRFSPAAFAATRLTQPLEERPPVTPPLTSAFANYDLSYTHTAVRGLASSAELGALAELGFSGTRGVLTSTHVARNLNDDEALGPRSTRRLETAFTRDFPDDNTSLRLGDSSTRPGMWGRQLYFGGVQFGRNFALSPGFITQPIPVLAGQSTAPSTVELYVNDALRQTSQVPSGPFTIDNFPLLTGTGQARLVVRDVLGRETVLVQNFFTSSSLLKAGLSDWNVQAGAVRRNLGVDSANYGSRFASGHLRYGASNDFTLETQAETSRMLRGGGVGLSAALFNQALGQAAIALSDDEGAGRGALWMLGAEHLTLRHGFTLRGEAATREYRRVGQEQAQAAYRRQLLASYTYFSESFGHFGVAAARAEIYDAGTVKTYTANYSMRIGGQASLTFSATRVSGASSGGSSFGVNLLVPLDGRVTMAGSTTHRAGKLDAYVSASRSLGAESGSGWRALAGRRLGEEYGEGGVYHQGSHGLVTADVSASRQQQTARLGAQGGLLFTDGEVFASRKLQESFALVEVPGYAGVGVGFQSTVLARTDDNGRALVPRLMPYRRNAIRLDPSELPISAELDTIEMIAVPPARAGVKVAFPVRSGRGALLSIRLEDGQPAPAGAEVELAGDSREFFVARRGEAFVTGLRERNTLRLKWKGQRCELEVALPEGARDEIARLGPYVCAGVAR
jgi:outer membrane usher protein